MFLSLYIFLMDSVKNYGFPYSSFGLGSVAAPLDTTVTLEKMESPVELTQKTEKKKTHLIYFYYYFFYK